LKALCCCCSAALIAQRAVRRCTQTRMRRTPLLFFQAQWHLYPSLMLLKACAPTPPRPSLYTADCRAEAPPPLEGCCLIPPLAASRRMDGGHSQQPGAAVLTLGGAICPRQPLAYMLYITPLLLSTYLYYSLPTYLCYSMRVFGRLLVGHRQFGTVGVTRTTRLLVGYRRGGVCCVPWSPSAFCLRVRMDAAALGWVLRARSNWVNTCSRASTCERHSVDLIIASRGKPGSQARWCSRFPTRMCSCFRTCYFSCV